MKREEQKKIIIYIYLHSKYIIFLLFFLAFHHFTAVPGLLSFFYLHIKSRESREQHF